MQQRVSNLEVTLGEVTQFAMRALKALIETIYKKLIKSAIIDSMIFKKMLAHF